MPSESPALIDSVVRDVSIVGRGRLGIALAAAFRAAGLRVDGPLGRGAAAEAAAVVLLCVPDRELASAAGAIAPGRLVGHCSGAATLRAVAPHEAFSMHPLMTVVLDVPPRFAGAACAVAGSTPRATATAESLCRALGMRPITVAEEHRALYHAAAAAASNYLVTVESMAELLGRRAGLSRDMLAPLVRAAVEHWISRGRDALTGPIARGDADTVARQRAAVEAAEPTLLPLWDALARATAEVAGRNAS